MTRPDSPSVTSLAERIFNYLRRMPHDPITRKQLAEAMETSPHNTIFGMALAEARNMASRSGDCITSCAWNSKVKAPAMRYLPAGQENGELLVPLFTKSAVTMYHMGSLQREARYGMANGADQTTRKYAAYLESTMSVAGEQMARARELILTVMETVQRSQAKDAEIERLERELASRDGSRVPS